MTISDERRPEEAGFTDAKYGEEYSGLDINANIINKFLSIIYHNIVNNISLYYNVSPSSTNYFTSLAAFESQLRELYSHGGWCMGTRALDEFYGIRTEATAVCQLRGYPVLLTFDDGWQEAVEVGGPVLENNRCEALLFVTTDFVGRPHFLTRHQLQQLPQDLFRVGSHGRTHRMLSLLSENEIRKELEYSKGFLEDATGYPVDALSIPSGAMDVRVRRVAVEVGYRFLFTSEVHLNDIKRGPMDIGRIAIKRNTSLRAFRGYVQHRVTWEQSRRWFLQAPKKLLGLPRYERLRRHLLGEASWQRVTHES